MSLARSLLAVALGLAALCGPAFAHAHLKLSKPAAGATLATAPTELDLTFSEPLNLRFTGVTVTGPDKGSIATGEAALAPGDATTLTVPVAGPLKAGAYTVNWHALSADGHKTTGAYGFTVKP